VSRVTADILYMFYLLFTSPSIWLAKSDFVL